MLTRYRHRYSESGYTRFDLADEITTERAVQLAKQVVKKLAGQKIDAMAPEWKQRNYIARGLQLEHKGRRSGLNASEQSEASAIEAFWADVVAIRQASDQIEAEIDAAASDPGTPHAVLDVPREDNPAWP